MEEKNIEEQEQEQPVEEKYQSVPIDLGKEASELSVAVVKAECMLNNVNNILSRYVFQSADNVYTNHFDTLNARAADYIMYKNSLIEQVKGNIIPAKAQEHPEILNSCIDFEYNPYQNTVIFYCDKEKYQAISSELAEGMPNSTDVSEPEQVSDEKDDQKEYY